MNSITIKTDLSAAEEIICTGHEQYIFQRVLDALLREDVRACVSSGALTSGSGTPSQYADLASTWLKISHFGNGILWIPVQRSSFMQDWKLCTKLPLLWQQNGESTRELHALKDVLACFAIGLSEDAAELFRAFVHECEVAVKHRELCEKERDRWFDELKRNNSADLSSWHARLLHYDRLGAFLDHPFYPTARAKIGFDSNALASYSPEFQRSFKLRWLAVPRSLYHPSVENEQGWPTLWPDFIMLGLPASLSETHVLVPIHPHVWENQLDAFLTESGLADKIIRAPYSYLTVVPTLSVRTVALQDTPHWHMKLPLTIRTLGAKNIRTIKPSTVCDGHSIQSLLGAIASQEPAIRTRLLLTYEECGAHVDNRMFLGYLLRCYPAETMQDSTLIPVASLLAQAPSGRLVVEDAAKEFYANDLEAFFNDYLDLTLRLHLLLWVRYGIALESNQQNSVVVLDRKERRMRLLLKDNDAARIHVEYLKQRWPALASCLQGLQDQRIAVAEFLPLAQMFTTITLQLNIAVLVERIAPLLGKPAEALYANVRQRIEATLAALANEGEDITLAHSVLLNDERLYIKYLLIAATLTEKSETGAADVNKFYGYSAPNFLREA